MQEFISYNYYLSTFHMRLPKNTYIGTGTWIFLIVNLIKVPQDIFVWKTITPESVSFDLLMVVPVIAGAFSGFYLVKLIS